jgi:hypothetical protein
LLAGFYHGLQITTIATKLQTIGKFLGNVKERQEIIYDFPVSFQVIGLLVIGRCPENSASLLFQPVLGRRKDNYGDVCQMGLLFDIV